MNKVKDGTIDKWTVGIDVAKDQLKVKIASQVPGETADYSRSHTFANTTGGFKNLLKLTRVHIPQTATVWFIMEATGVYYQQLAWFLHDRQANVCVLVPTRAKYYAKSLPIKSKTDSIDAGILARYGLERQPRQWTPGSDRIRQIKALLRERQQLQDQRTQLANRLHAARHAWNHPESSIQRLGDHMEQIDQYLADIDTELDQLWQSDQQLAGSIIRIAGVNGLGSQTVLQVIAETNGFALITNRQQLASYGGLDVVLDESGNRQGNTQISKQGNARIRRALYMPALSAIQHNRALKTFYQRLVDKHPDNKMIAVTAVMRKLLLLIYSLWKSEQEYDPEFHYQQIIKNTQIN